MTTLKPQRAHTSELAAGAWAVVALTPFGCFFGALAVAFSNEGNYLIVSQMIMGVLLFVAAPEGAFILAVHAARAGRRSGKIAVVVAGLLLLATLVCTLLVRLPDGRWWIGLAVTAVVAVLVLAGVCSRRIAVAESGLLFLAALTVLTWPPLADRLARSSRDRGGRGAGSRWARFCNKPPARAGRYAAGGEIACGYRRSLCVADGPLGAVDRR